MCTHIFLSPCNKKSSFVFSLAKKTKTKINVKEKEKIWHQTNAERHFSKKKVKVRTVFRNDSVGFQQESLQFKLSKLGWKKFPLSLLQKKSNADGTTRLCVMQRKEPKIKTYMALFFPYFTLNKKIFCLKLTKIWLDKWQSKTERKKL